MSYILFVCVSSGFDYPDDPYVLAGSCGLEYVLELVSGQSGGYGGYDRYDSGYGSGHRKQERYCMHHLFVRFSFARYLALLAFSPSLCSVLLSL